MAIRLKVGNDIFEADTPEEIVQIKQLIYVPNIVKFTNSLNANGWKLISALSAIGPDKEMSSKELCEVTKLSSLALPSIMRHLNNVARKNGLAIKDIIVSEVRQLIRYYRITEYYSTELINDQGQHP